MMRALLTAAAIALPSAFAYGADPLAGTWRLSGDGPVLLFEETGLPSGELSVTWIDGDELAILPGTNVGSAVPAGKAGVYDCTLLHDPLSGHSKKTLAVIRLEPTTGLDFTFEPYKQNLHVDWWRMLPRWLRLRVTRTDTRPKGIDGGRRTDAPPAFINL